jgi:epoxyqueuosine reductase QueG
MEPTMRVDRILARARECGATVAGLASLRAVREAPSAKAEPILHLPSEARSVLVLGLAHPPEEPELDWWGGRGGTPGNRVLQNLAMALEPWLRERAGVVAWILPYHVEQGGLFLKDAAVLAGLGVLGVDNLVITPTLGPRVRWKALLLDLETPDPPGDVGEGLPPCDGCARPCVEACPMGALEGGRFHLSRCRAQMQRDEAEAVSRAGGVASKQRVRYCRACELACPVGRGEEPT